MKRILLLLMLLQYSYSVSSQSAIIGVVSDEMGGISNVNISIKNSKKGTVTNTEGVFEIFAKTNDTLLISHIAYQPEEIVVGKHNIIDVVLSDSGSLDEVVVTAIKGRRTYCGFGCTYEIITVSVIEEPNLKLYPNPSPNGIFNLSIDKEYNTLEIQVTSISGQIILSRTHQKMNKTLEIDLSKYPTGLYIINTIADGKRLATKKAIVR
jgi:hypothetical protein